MQDQYISRLYYSVMRRANGVFICEKSMSIDVQNSEVSNYDGTSREKLVAHKPLLFEDHIVKESVILVYAHSAP